MHLLKFKPNTDWASLSLRLFLGVMFFMHGLGKPVVVGMEEVTQGMLAQGFPAWSAYVSTVIEIIGGLMLIIGWQTRLGVLALLPVSIGILVYHFPFGWVFHNEGGGYEYPQLIVVSLITLFFLGSGKYAITKQS